MEKDLLPELPVVRVRVVLGVVQATGLMAVTGVVVVQAEALPPAEAEVLQAVASARAEALRLLRAEAVVQEEVPVVVQEEHMQRQIMALMVFRAQVLRAATPAAVSEVRELPELVVQQMPLTEWQIFLLYFWALEEAGLAEALAVVAVVEVMEVSLAAMVALVRLVAQEESEEESFLLKQLFLQIMERSELMVWQVMQAQREMLANRLPLAVPVVVAAPQALAAGAVRGVLYIFKPQLLQLVQLPQVAAQQDQDQQPVAQAAARPVPVALVLLFKPVPEVPEVMAVSDVTQPLVQAVLLRQQQIKMCTSPAVSQQPTAMALSTSELPTLHLLT